MLETARRLISIACNRQRVDLDTDDLLELAVVRLLEVLGGAATRVPSDTQALHHEIPWPEIIGLRNRLIHGYDAVDLDIVWQIVTVDVPLLVDSLDRILASGESPASEG